MWDCFWFVEVWMGGARGDLWVSGGRRRRVIPLEARIALAGVCASWARSEATRPPARPPAMRDPCDPVGTRRGSLSWHGETVFCAHRSFFYPSKGVSTREAFSDGRHVNENQGRPAAVDAEVGIGAPRRRPAQAGPPAACRTFTGETRGRASLRSRSLPKKKNRGEGQRQDFDFLGLPRRTQTIAPPREHVPLKNPFSPRLPTPKPS